MSELAIRVDRLGKQYRLGVASPYQTLRERINGFAAAPLRLFRKPAAASRAEAGARFWALKDVSFDVHRGEVMGVIGRNGAGKSTLLKILSRITEPTEGGADLTGRVGSLLEVGTGFHAELTGRENIFLNGAILGMKRAEVLRKFGAIVEFAEIEKFLDTPVKHYSSGMYMRLAFAVAAHLEPEILVVDEVLAVGDLPFQKKCLGKMGEVARSGRTVLFVSHHLPSIEMLTNRSIWLEAGRVRMVDETPAVTTAYLASAGSTETTRSLSQWGNRKTEGPAEIVRFCCLDDDGKECRLFRPRSRVRVCLGVQFHQPLQANLAVVFETANEVPLFTTHLLDGRPAERLEGYREFLVDLCPNLLRQGPYLVSLAVGSSNWNDMIDVVLHFPAFEIEGHPVEGFFPLDRRWGPMFLDLPWTPQ
jgi:lipopolysaccharide transport system ATP-binding protein